MRVAEIREGRYIVEVHLPDEVSDEKAERFIDMLDCTVVDALLRKLDEKALKEYVSAAAEKLAQRYLGPDARIHVSIKTCA